MQGSKVTNCVNTDKIFCKAKIFPSLHVTLDCQCAEQDLKAFKHSIKRRPSYIRRDFVQTELETNRWLQGNSIDIKLGNTDLIDEPYVLSTRENSAPIKRQESQFFCFTEKIVLAKRKNVVSGAKPMTNRRKKQNTKGSNNSSCTSEPNSQQFVLYPRIQNCECCLRHSESDAKGAINDFYKHAKTYFNNCSMPRISEANIEVKGSGYGCNIGSHSKSKVNKVLLCLPKIRVKRNVAEKKTKKCEGEFPKLTIYGKFNKIHNHKVGNACK